MNRMKALAALAILVCVLFPLAAFAEAPDYQPSTEVTLKGDVVWFSADPVSHSWNGACAIMKDGNNEIQVFLGPNSFLEKEGVTLKMGDGVRIVGSRTQWKGTEIILARELTASSKTVQLRTAQGEPRW